MKAKQCIPCLGSEIKEAIRELGDVALDKTLEIIPDCPDSLEIELCIKPPRARSEYQVFVSECMKSKPIKGKPFGEASKYMKECAVSWRKRKEERDGSQDLSRAGERGN